MKNSEMAGINPTLSVIILNVSGVNTLIKRQRLAELSKKRAPTTCCSQNRYFRFKDTKQLKVKEWKKIRNDEKSYERQPEWLYRYEIKQALKIKKKIITRDKKDVL